MYNAYITRIKDLRKHTNADRLQCGTVFGNSVIVGLDTQLNQLGIYFPSDGKLGVEYAEINDLLRRKDENGNNAGGYLDPDKRNIKALSLRGERSDGLFMPLSSLNEFCDITSLKEGDTVSVLNGVVICEKYIPRSKQRNNSQGTPRTKKEPKENYLYFAEHVDTAQLAYSLGNFRTGDRVLITLKMHGTSGRTSNAIMEKKEWNWYRRLLRKPKITRCWGSVSGTRRTVLTKKSAEEGGYYGDNEFRIKYHDLLKDKLQKGESIYYEIVGWVNKGTTIMATCNNRKLNNKEFLKKYGETTTFSYGCEEGMNDIYVYRMTMTNEDGYTIEYPWDLVKLRCEQMGVKYVPELNRFTFTTEEDLLARVNEYVDGADPVGLTHIREGIVARIENRERFAAYKHKNFEFKVLESIIKDIAERPDVEEEESLK